MTAKSLIASYGSFGRSAALAMCEALVCMSVWPSGALRATASVPIVPPDPGRFSTITEAPSAFPSSSPTSRPSVSPVPPAASGTMILIGFDG
jgi:hypothetical protein